MPMPPEIDIEILEIRDTDRSTRGGPPHWLVAAVVAGVFLATAGLFMILWLNGAFAVGS